MTHRNRKYRTTFPHLTGDFGTGHRMKLAEENAANGTSAAAIFVKAALHWRAAPAVYGALVQLASVAARRNNQFIQLF